MQYEFIAIPDAEIPKAVPTFAPRTVLTAPTKWSWRMRFAPWLASFRFLPRRCEYVRNN